MPEDVSALNLVLTGDPALFAIVRLSLIVSLSAVMFAAPIGVPFGALIALTRFHGREIAIVVLNALMGLPPVVVGLAVFLSLSRSGPLGSWGLLFTPQAMVIAHAFARQAKRRLANNVRRIERHEDDEMDALAGFVLDKGHYPWDIVK